MEPRYSQVSLNINDRHNKLQQVLSPNENEAGVWIHQDAWFHLGKLDKDFSTEYIIKKKGNGVYAFILIGDVSVDGTKLNARDGFGVWDTDKISINADSDAEILLMEVPMVI